MTVIDSLDRIFEIEDAIIRERLRTKDQSTYLLEITTSSGRLLIRAYTSASSIQEAQKRAPFAQVSKYRNYPIYLDEMVHYDI